MTELLTELERLKEQILSERCAQELPGDSPMVTTARKLLLAGLLGHLPTNSQRAEGEERFLPALLSPVAPVETASEVSIDTEVAEAPVATARTGETQEEEAQEPPPAPPLGDPNICDDCGAYKAKGVCETCHPVIEPPEPEGETTDLAEWVCAYVREAQAQGIQMRFDDILCFIQEQRGITEEREARRLACKVEKRLEQDERVEIHRWVMRQERTGRSVTPSDESALEPEAPESVEAETEAETEVGQAGPSWWTAENKRYCQQCQALIQPKRIGAAKTWEGRIGYLKREYCSRECYQKARVKTKARTDGKD